MTRFEVFASAQSEKEKILKEIACELFRVIGCFDHGLISSDECKETMCPKCQITVRWFDEVEILHSVKRMNAPKLQQDGNHEKLD